MRLRTLAWLDTEPRPAHVRSFFPRSAPWYIALVLCGILYVGAPRWSLSANLLEDPSFEDGSPRVLQPQDGFQGLKRPWGGEEPGVVTIVRGPARTGSQSARLQAGDQAQLYQRFPTTRNTAYTATCWIRADPTRGLVSGDYTPVVLILRTDVICPVEVCDNDGDEDLDHAEALASTPLTAQTTAWEPITVHFNSGPFTQLGLLFFTVLSGNQFIQVDDCSVEERASQETLGRERDICAQRYGSMQGFQLCFETGMGCGVEAAKNDVQSCNDVCSAGGGHCLTIYANDSRHPCVVDGEVPDGCARTGVYDDICVCSR